jgi:D-amino-acid oxidase
VSHTASDILVIGAGVIGLSTAICLAEAGVSVTVAAAEPPQDTTSAAAGAVFGVHLVGADDRIGRWADITLARLTELSQPGLGANALFGIVRVADGQSCTAGTGGLPPEFAAGASLTPCAPAEIPPGYQYGWRHTAALIAMPPYLDYLAERLLRAGGTSAFGQKFGRLDDARAFAPAARVIVNATGCGARDLVADDGVEPARGQAVTVANPGLTDFFVGTGAAAWDLTYVFPHGDVVVLGGTERLGDWNREPDPATAGQIIAACTAVRPELAGARVLAHRVGLRPTRPYVRLETEQAGPVTVVHSYGHGGGGVTLSWGCAEDAAALALAALG